MPTNELMFNIVDLPDAEFTRAQRRVPNNSAPWQRLWFDGGKSWMFVEHIYLQVYNTHVTDRLQSREYADGLLDRFSKRRGDMFVAEERRKIYRFSDRSGWVYAAHGRNTAEVCISARIGFISDSAKTGARTSERYDTSFTFRDCSDRRSIDDVVKWVEDTKIVESVYNRAGQG